MLVLEKYVSGKTTTLQTRLIFILEKRTHCQSTPIFFTKYVPVLLDDEAPLNVWPPVDEAPLGVRPPVDEAALGVWPPVDEAALGVWPPVDDLLLRTPTSTLSINKLF